MHISLSPGVGISVGYYRKRIFAMTTKSDGGQQRNNQPTNGGAAAVAAAVAAARQREVGGSLAAARRWQQRDGGTQRDGGSAWPWWGWERERHVVACFDEGFVFACREYPIEFPQ
jgi:hypothetical protein